MTRRRGEVASVEWAAVLVAVAVVVVVSPEKGQHPFLTAFPGRAARERKREASEIPEWIDRCYVIRAAARTPQEARGRERQSGGWGHWRRLSSSQTPGK